MFGNQQALTSGRATELKVQVRFGEGSPSSSRFHDAGPPNVLDTPGPLTDDVPITNFGVMSAMGA